MTYPCLLFLVKESTPMKLCHMTDHKVGMITFVQFLLGKNAPQKFGIAKKSKIWSDFALNANILGNDRNIKNRKQG